jgi:hypothetical protein
MNKWLNKVYQELGKVGMGNIWKNREKENRNV